LTCLYLSACQNYAICNKKLNLHKQGRRGSTVGEVTFIETSDERKELKE
jgi:hypothetical protein